MSDDLSPDLKRTVGKLMKAAHAKGDRAGERKGFARAVGMFLKAMSAGDQSAGGAVIPPPKMGCGTKPKRRKKKRKVVKKAIVPPKAFRLSKGEATLYAKALQESALDTPEAVEAYAAELHAKTVKELAAEKAKTKYHPEQHAVVDRLADALA